MIILYADEDIPHPLVNAIRLQGIKVVTTQESKMIGKKDEEQLRYATIIDSILFTQNIKDFVQMHNRFQKERVDHAGIVVSKKDAVGTLLRKMLHLSTTLTMSDMKNRLEYLNNW